MKKLTTALIFAGLFSAASVQAATIEFANTKAMTTTNWTDSLAIGKFDTTLGTLTSIQFVLTGGVSGVGKAESLDNSASNVMLNLGSVLTLTRPDSSTLVIANPLFSNTYSFTTFDGVIDFGGTSGTTTSTVFNSKTASFDSNSASDFGLFSSAGGGNVNLGLGATGASSGSGSGNLITQFNTLASGDVKVIYTYTAAVTAVPEPETYAMMLLGMGMVGAIARRRAAKKAA